MQGRAAQGLAARPCMQPRRLMLRSGLLHAPEAALDVAIEVAPTRSDARRLRADLRFRQGRYSRRRMQYRGMHPTASLGRLFPTRQLSSLEQPQIGSLGLNAIR